MKALDHTRHGAALAVHDLSIGLVNGSAIVENVGFALPPGGSLGIVGESGSGKTTLAMALVGHTGPGIRIASGRVEIAGRDILAANPKEVAALRGRQIAYVPQDAPSALNPSMRAGDIVAEMLRIHAPERYGPDSIARAMGLVDLPSDSAFLKRYPHQLSGGQQQRLAIAAAMAAEPRVLVLDEPTTGLDMITQKRILDEVGRLRARTGVAVVVISHDLEVVEELCGATLVLYAGRVVEQGPTRALLKVPAHPYTRGLIGAVARPGFRPRGMHGSAPPPNRRRGGCLFSPRCPQARDECRAETPLPQKAGPEHWVSCPFHAEATIADPVPVGERKDDTACENPVLDIRDLTVAYRGQRVLKDVSLTIHRGERVALLGQSGSGKTTLGRCVAGLVDREAGDIRLNGTSLSPRVSRRTRDQLRAVQMVLQNPYVSFNPQFTIGATLERAMRMLCDPGRAGQAGRPQLLHLLERVRLPAEAADAYPAQLSGGELQRAAIAQALACGPDLIICDEATSALDVSVQAVVIELLRDLTEQEGVSLLVISHDLGVVGSISDRIYVLDQGVIVEHAPTPILLAAPKSDLARRLIASRPDTAAGSTGFHATSQRTENRHDPLHP
ncbi:ABC transporter ATP-binding protein [Mesorhizobium shangrilense]|uniref:ABC transporter ATP-binding protein n=1 Tax=Mesorhizobium shangrilense TaxID=460060 RepID=A0ABV2DRQ3_9HYPH